MDLDTCIVSACVRTCVTSDEVANELGPQSTYVSCVAKNIKHDQVSCKAKNRVLK